MKKLVPAQMIDFRDNVADGYRVELDYAKFDNLLFGERIYRTNARLWLHEELAAVVLRAAQDCHRQHGFRFVLHDGLRTVEAQEKMLLTERARANLHWLEEPRLLSPPGTGGHPRGMAVDISLETEGGETLDMGTPFDFLAEDAAPEKNPAHRDYKFLSEQAAHNREILTGCMLKAARDLKMQLVPLAQEWWDFRFPREVYEAYAPLRDADLPPAMRMVTD